MRIPSISLAKPLERSIADGHPWVYRDALAPARGGEPAAEAGSVLDLIDRRGRFLARGLAESGPIGLRVWSLKRVEFGEALFARRVQNALELRDQLPIPDTDALRWVHGEGDRMPGFVCDRYGSRLVVALDGEGVHRHKDEIFAALWSQAETRGIDTIVLKQGRGREKQLTCIQGVLPSGEFEVRERGMKLIVDLQQGQKTGLFLDHRDARAGVRAMAQGRRVLNLYGYTGGFSIAAGLGGAREVVTVDQSEPAIELAQRGWLLNGLPEGRHRGVAADVRAFLDACRGGPDAAFDLVISDPPSFAPNRRSVDKALDAYRKLHRSAIAQVADGGLYLAASCSAHVPRATFEATMRDGARAAKRWLQVVQRWSAGADHPVPLGFPEGDYLTTTLCRVSSR